MTIFFYKAVQNRSNYSNTRPALLEHAWHNGRLDQFLLLVIFIAARTAPDVHEQPLTNVTGVAPKNPPIDLMRGSSTHI